MTSTHATSRTCPDCSQQLETIAHEGVTLDRCAAGHGLWLDKGELRAVVASEAADRSEAEELAALDAAAKDAGHAVVAELGRTARACPDCSAPMRITEYAVSGIAIDECNEHGTWLDPNELERIEAYAEGIRRQGALGARGDAARAAQRGSRISGIDVPAHLLATLRSAAVPPPA